MRVLVSDPIAPEGIKKLEEAGLEVDTKTFPPEELKANIGKYDAIIVRSATKVTKEVIEAGTNLKVIARAGVGLDNVDANAAREKGIKVANTPGATSISVAELALGMMLAASRFIPQGTASLKAGKWEKKKMEGVELYGKILGIIGCGRIGRELAKRCQALGMRVLGCDLPGVCDPEELACLGITFVLPEDVLTQSDYISIHVPMTESTRHMIGAPQFQKMKDGVILINCARGGVVDEAALLDALKSGKVRAAALDVFETEPPKDNPLLALDNVIATPHIGAATTEGQYRAGVEVAELVVKNLQAKITVV